MLKNIVEIISNPLLYYSGKSQISVFRNFCLFKNTGNFYNFSISKADVGRVLEFRFKLDKYLKMVNVLTPIILYFIYIHVNFSIFSLMCFELIWILIVNGARIFCSSIYSSYLIKNFGQYEIVEFSPPISKEKTAGYVTMFKSKVIALIILLVFLSIPAFILQISIKACLTTKYNGFKNAVNLSNMYFSLYPKSPKIYDMRAYAKYAQKDYEGALKDYKTVLKLTGKKFTSHDVVRLANLLLLQKRLSTPQEAVDTFNEYVTLKSMKTLDAEQITWIVSIFKIENNITESVMQEYEELLSSLDAKDSKNQFYISSDKAYILYLMQDYNAAINDYNILISYAEGNKDIYAKELKSLYAERGWAKKRIGNEMGANDDFIASQIPITDLSKFEPAFSNQEFVVDKF